MSMLRTARQAGRSDLLRVVVSVRRPEDLFYAGELEGPETTVVYTRQDPPGWARPPGRLALDDLRPLVDLDQTIYVCGSSGFADAVTDQLAELGQPVGRIRVERFGATG
jgi:ferredoxin-NADP reductase